MNLNKIINALSVMFTTAIIVGLTHSIYYRINSVPYLPHSIHSYVTYSLKYFNTWVLISLFLIIPFVIIKKSCDSLLPPSTKTKIRFNASILLSGIVSCSFLIFGGWAINYYLLPSRFHPFSLLGDVGILLFSIFLAWIILNTIRDNKHKKSIFVFHRIVAVLLVLSLIGLNSYVFVHYKKIPKRPNILFILIDALRADHLSSYGYPRKTSPTIDSIAREGVTFTNAISSAPWTVPAMASMFTSVYPTVHKVLRNSAKLGLLTDDFTTLAERLAENDYETAGIMSNPWLNGSYKINQGFKSYETLEWNNGAKLTSRALRWLDKRPANPYFLSWLNSSPATPFFLYLHYMDVHGPYDTIPSPYSKYYIESKDTAFDRELTEEELRKVPSYWGLGNHQKTDLNYYVTLYDQEISLVDAEIKKLMNKLEKMDLLKDTIVVITSDHGVEFLEHGDWDMGNSLHDEELHIPLIIRFPSELPQNHVIDNQVRSVDIMPTLLKILNIPVHDNINGQDLSPLISQEKELNLDAFSEASERDVYNYIKSLRTDRFKLIYDTEKDHIKFYDLKADPNEQVNIASNKMFSNQLKRTYDLLTATIKTNEHLKEQYMQNQMLKLDDELQERLRSLGYIQ